MKSVITALLLVFITGPLPGGAAAAGEGSLATCHADPIYYCRAGRGKTTLLFIHGWGGRADFWNEQLRDFSADYSVIAIELPGHAHLVPYKTVPTIAGMAKAINTLIHRLKLKEVVLVGHDMGAVIALAIPASRSGASPVRALVAIESLVDTRVVIPEKQYKQVRKRLDKNFAATARQLTIDMFSEAAAPELVDRIANSVAATDPVSALLLLDDFFHADLAADLSNFPGQLVILNTHFNPPRLEKLQKLCPGLVSMDVPWDEHMAFLERPEVFNRKLKQVLKLLLDKER